MSDAPPSRAVVKIRRKVSMPQLYKANPVKIQSGISEQARLRQTGNVGEEHGNQKPLLAITGASHDDAVELHLPGRVRPLQTHGHFCPGSDGVAVAKFNSVLAHADGGAGKSQALSGAGRKGDRVGVEFSCAHSKGIYH